MKPTRYPAWRRRAAAKVARDAWRESARLACQPIIYTATDENCPTRVVVAHASGVAQVEAPSQDAGTRTMHGITMRRGADGSYDVTMPDRWFCASPANDAEGNLEGEVCMLLEHLWNAASGVQSVEAQSKPHITWAHEVGGWWRLELNGKTVSEHKREADFKLARDRLIAALGVAAVADTNNKPVTGT